MRGRSIRGWAGRAALAAMLAGCGGSEPGTGPGGGETAGEFLAGLPSWDEYAPPGVVTDSVVDSTRTPVAIRDTVASVTTVDTAGVVTTRTNVAYACTDVPYTLSKNPQQIVIYNPDQDILFPGALIQGKSHALQAGSLKGITVKERTPINVSIPGFSFPTGSNFRTVDTVDQAHVAQAIGSIVGNYTAGGLQAPTASTFEMRTYNSEKEFALQAGLSGKYLGFSAKASGSTSRNSSETTVAVQFYQRMYDVVVAAPPTPAQWFTSQFTPAKLQAQIDAGFMGQDNPPIYISQVTYGRSMMFTLTSTASESDIRATLNASYKFVTGQAGLDLSAQQHEILSRSRIAITSIGGNDSATIAMIQSGDWRAYFTQSAPFSTAAPLSYVFKNVGDGSIAKVTEATNYSIRACQEYSTLPGQFLFDPVQSITAPVATPFETRLVDVDNDGRMDLVWNHRGVTSNQLAFALGQASGTFAAAVVVSHPDTAAEGWGNYGFQSGDFNGDGKADVAWNHRGALNKTYVAVSTGSGWTFAAAQQRPEGGWTPYQWFVLDTDGDGDDDLVFNQLGATNRTYVNFSNGDGTFDMSQTYYEPAPGGWSAYAAFVGEIDNNARQDLIFNTVGPNTGNWTYTGRFNAGGRTYTLSSAQQHFTPCCWQAYQRITGDFNGDGRTDLFWSSAVNSGGRALHGGLANGSGGWTYLNPWLAIPLESGGGFTAQVGDIDGDGYSDIIWNQLGATSNKVQTGRGKADGRPEISPAEQVHPALTNWSQATTLVGDVTGDGRDDLVWVIPGASVQVYVAEAQP
ncbi:MAG: thiol-activated cytolysin family protein [Gemmatimonadetes bacterium]|nr:thiol-activated cytolysin family protein [Gemmatimonadota bacterium]MBK7786595.1 thiol-activated cytolysin family protein [Gemmatimonadota bacterium]MBK9065993.1 thiol-activated cytolysin family protein [Gemmatimonadota bacterium]